MKNRSAGVKLRELQHTELGCRGYSPLQPFLWSCLRCSEGIHCLGGHAIMHTVRRATINATRFRLLFRGVLSTTTEEQQART